MRKPRSLTCWSARPRYSRSPSGSRAAEIAGAVEAPAPVRRERVGHEALGGEVGPVRGSPGRARRRPRRARPARRPAPARSRAVEHVDAAGRGSAGRSGFRSPPRISVGGERPVRDVHRGLGDAVHVDERVAPDRRAAPPRARSARRLEGLAAEDRPRAEARPPASPRAASAASELAERRRRLVEHGHAARRAAGRRSLRGRGSPRTARPPAGRRRASAPRSPRPRSRRRRSGTASRRRARSEAEPGLRWRRAAAPRWRA